MKLLLACLLIFLNFTGLAAVNGKLIFSQDKIFVGETVPAQIIFPIDGMDNNFQEEDFINKKISEAFYITEVKDHHVSENNHDIYVVNVLITVIRSFIPGHEQVFQLGHLDIRLATSDSIKLEKFPDKLPQDFIFAESQFELPLDPKLKRILSALSLILLIGLLYWLLIKRKQQYQLALAKKAHAELYSKWQKLISQAKARSEFETIFASADEWGKLFVSPSSYENYKKSMEQTIYKKQWDQLELAEVQKIHSELAKDLRG